MHTTKSTTVQEIQDQLEWEQLELLLMMKKLFGVYRDVTLECKRNCHVRYLPNWSRFYFNVYKRKWADGELGYSHAKQLIEQYPMFASYFEEIKTRVGKMYLTSTSDATRKAIPELVRLCYEVEF
jgi:hypothetical protein